MYGNYSNRTCDFYDWLPDAPIITPLLKPATLAAVPDSAQDNGVTLRIYGWDSTGKRIYDPTDKLDGFVVIASTARTPAASVVARIDRISKEASKGYVQLFACDPATGSVTATLGNYKPEEAEPMYRRMRTSRRCASLRIAFRKRDKLITGLTDVINLRSKPAVVNAVMALSIRLTEPERAQTLLAQAAGWLRDEQAQRDQAMPPRPIENIGNDEAWQDWDRFY